MAEFNYNKYVADMAQRTGPLHEEMEEGALNEYEVTYVVQNGKCYRITDEGYKDEVSMDKCRMYAEAIEDTDVEVTDDEFDSAEFDKEPSKKDIKAAEKEFSLEVPKADSSADSAFEKAKQVIKIKVGKLLAQPKGKRTMSPDMAALKQFIQKPEIKKAFKSRGLDVMDFVKDVIA